MSRSRILSVLYTLYFLLLLGAYHVCVVPSYAHIGFASDFKPANALVSLVLVMGLSCIIRPSGRPSGFLLSLIFITGPIPALVLMANANLPFEFGILVTLSFTVVTFVAQYPWRFALPAPRLSFSTTLAVLVSFAVLGVVALALAGGIRYLNFDIFLVYEFRRDAADAVPGIFGYIIQTLSYAIIPFSLALAIQAKQFTVAGLLTVCSIMLAALSNHKAPAFVPLLIVATMWFMSRSKPEVWLVLGLITAVIAASAESLFSIGADSEAGAILSDLLVRRVLMVPALLDYFYWQFFTDNAALLWAESRFGLRLFDNPYGMNAALLIGAEYFGDKGTHANTGFVGSGFAQANHFGVLLYAFLIGLLVAFVDRLGQRLGSAVTTAAFVLTVSNAATGTDLTNLPLTGGLGVLVVVASITASASLSFSRDAGHNWAPCGEGKAGPTTVP